MVTICEQKIKILSAYHAVYAFLHAISLFIQKLDFKLFLLAPSFKKNVFVLFPSCEIFCLQIAFRDLKIG